MFRLAMWFMRVFLVAVVVMLATIEVFEVRQRDCTMALAMGLCFVSTAVNVVVYFIRDLRTPEEVARPEGVRMRVAVISAITLMVVALVLFAARARRLF